MEKKLGESLYFLYLTQDKHFCCLSERYKQTMTIQIKGRKHLPKRSGSRFFPGFEMFTKIWAGLEKKMKKMIIRNRNH